MHPSPSPARSFGHFMRTGHLLLVASMLLACAGQSSAPATARAGQAGSPGPLGTDGAAAASPTGSDLPATLAGPGPTGASDGTGQVGPDPATIKVTFEPVVGGLSRPVAIAHAGDGSGRLFVIEKVGKVRIVKDGQLLGTPFLDISGKVDASANERGLLGIAFHPKYKTNGFFFVGYTKRGGGDVTYARYKVTMDDPNQADPGSEKVLLSWAHARGNHNGGNVMFGPDGYLYLGTGDGGAGGDPDENGQDLGRFLGKMLRIDVDTDLPYIVPPTNPFVETPRAKPEVWAYGLRNPWRYSFDRQTGDLYIADVGQNKVEEVDFQPAASRGGVNYGWDEMEGSQCYEPAQGCQMDGMTLPVAEYPHNGTTGGCSITGGFVYRGDRFPDLFGAYFYADYCTQNVWALSRDGSGTWRNATVAKSPGGINSFGEDEAGEIYAVFDDPTNQLMRMVSSSGVPTSMPPTATSTRQVATATRSIPTSTPFVDPTTTATPLPATGILYLPMCRRDA